MAYTFAVDTSKIEDLSNTLKETKELVKTEITAVFEEDIKAMEEFWSGSSFDTFKGGAEKFKEALDNLPEVINVFSDVLDASEPFADACINAIDDSIGKIAE